MINWPEQIRKDNLSFHKEIINRDVTDECEHAEGRGGLLPGRQRLCKGRQGTERAGLGLTSTFVLLAHRVCWEMGRSDWRSEELHTGLAEELGFYPECN